ncbi:class I SAM-dependent methyltransferase [Salinibacter ruber]|uniref:class I SAM-dependent methyltransferase n=1 Tax=Salinibacter ruber TaxID=146919 RepID=UPI00355B582C
MVKQKSEKWLTGLNDNYLDWVYIDTTHSYEQTKKELEVSAMKVRKYGLICGHDYCNGNVPKRLNYGVIPAVHEFCIRYNWRIKYLTLEASGARSFALERI